MRAPTPTRARPHGSKRAVFAAFAALAGVVSAAALLAVAEVVALLLAHDGSPVLAVGSFVIDIVPRWAKEFAIETFGANDKLFLLGSIGLAVVVAAAVAGVLQWIRPPLGAVLIALAGALAVIAIVTRTGATPLASVPTVLGTVIGVVLLSVLVKRLRRWREAVAPDAPAPVGQAAGTSDGVGRSGPSDDPAAEGAAGTADTAGDSDEARPGHVAVDRRRFLAMTVIVAVGSAVVGAGSRIVSAATSSLAGLREALKIPAARSRVEVPAGAELDVPGLSSLYTSNADFYRVDTALTVPSIDPATWSLTVVGLVDTELTLSFQDVLDLGLDEYSITLTCVSNEVGGELLGTAKWLGVPIRDVLAKAGPQSGADMVLSKSIDGFTAGTPLGALTDDGIDAIFAVAMNGEPLPFEHGFPVRMVVPGLYGYVSATKWVTELKVTTFEADEAYWTPRGYSAEAPVKMSSRIDTPRIGKPAAAGPLKIAGVAWAQTVGIGKVEVSIDDGEWRPATLSTAVNADTWVQWVVDWEATTGAHYVAVRATDKRGNLQIQERAPIAPNGSSGWQRTLITVA
ncbi:molybdopterin-dependent oxidoreductase [Herbiconiux ginsengi]|uniref:DMSO/TMAO reductase YedYZ, molybdopterin-dependent catalytic subunit n=1 Tax=Herbiconiux ginsengi TaxID=381665 RepID=A0A1H3K4T4_9MICO|nr:molybdopterin-dependent oxidoreductase [Herbiconiux ginsengi]SDY47171.1 DMSO/TMAO reductase YedYZ, molybdopterin-dependent catalytic subunit [Herbiconiux ginsengi]